MYFFDYEAWFHLNIYTGMLITKTCTFWVLHNLYTWHEILFHFSWKVGVWCGVSRKQTFDQFSMTTISHLCMEALLSNLQP